MEGSRVSSVCLAILHTQGVLTGDLVALEFAFLVFLASVVRNSVKEVGMAAVTNACSRLGGFWEAVSERPSALS